MIRGDKDLQIEESELGWGEYQDDSKSIRPVTNLSHFPCVCTQCLLPVPSPISALTMETLKSITINSMPEQVTQLELEEQTALSQDLNTRTTRHLTAASHRILDISLKSPEHKLKLTFYIFFGLLREKPLHNLEFHTFEVRMYRYFSKYQEVQANITPLGIHPPIPPRYHPFYALPPPHR